MIEQIKYRYYYTGPLIFKSTLLPTDVEFLLSLCKKDKKQKYNKKLAGLIKEEYGITDYKKINKLLDPYLNLFKEAYENWYRSSFKNMTVKSAWVNYMKPYETNPIHTHSNCEFSSVFYLSFPKNLQKEIDNMVTSGAKPGDITFLLNAQDTPGFINSKVVTPKVGDFYIFPAGLNHFVNSFQSKGERISVAMNFDLTKLNFDDN